MSDTRKAFEAWAKQQFSVGFKDDDIFLLLRDREGGEGYNDLSVDGAWQGWKAAQLAAPASEPVSWLAAEEISNAHGVHESLKIFSNDPTGDNATGIVLTVLQAARFATTPAGYRLVPVEPTEEMIDAANECEASWKSIYPAMLAAAPQGEGK